MEILAQPPEVSLAEKYANSRERLKYVLKRCHLIAYGSNSKDSFYDLTDLEKNEKIKAIEDWCELILGYIEEGNNITSTKSLVRYYLHQLGARVADSFLNSITDGDVVEIFDHQSRRLFFNPELFEYSSYSPDEMFSAQWWKLYSRDTDITEKIMKNALHIYQEQVTEPFIPNIPKHIVSETSSVNKYQSEVELKLLAPVYLGSKLMGAVALERLKLL